MAAPSATLKALQNEETGIDITIPGIHEEEAPLGGVSILFEISICTKLDVYKSSLHKDEDVVQFSVFKAYREIEDLLNKLSKKYPKISLPRIPSSSNIDNLTADEKVSVLNEFMVAISRDKELSQSLIFNHFIGISSPKPQSNNVSNKNDTEKTVPEVEKVSESSDSFSKVKSAAKPDAKALRETQAIPEQVDLFEEIKTARGSLNDNDNRTTGGLFDDLDDDELFSTKPTSKSVQPAEIKKGPPMKVKKDAPPVILKQEMQNKSEKDADDSQIIIKDRNMGDISLFDEQDFGDHITKEEEPLFLVTPEIKTGKKNDLLFSVDSDTDIMNEDLNENLDDLLNLNPLPERPAHKGSESSSVSDSSPESDKQPIETVQAPDALQSHPKKPVPLPRKKSLGKNDVDNSGLKQPEVMPRKVFLKKPPEVPAKPVSLSHDNPISTKPPVKAKPVVLPKPKPPIKGPKPTLSKDIKNLDAVNANKPASVSRTESTVSNLSEDLGQLDILKYIEQEQKFSEAEPSLFD